MNTRTGYGANTGAGYGANSGYGAANPMGSTTMGADLASRPMAFHGMGSDVNASMLAMGQGEDEAKRAAMGAVSGSLQPGQVNVGEANTGTMGMRNMGAGGSSADVGMGTAAGVESVAAAHMRRGKDNSDVKHV